LLILLGLTGFARHFFIFFVFRATHEVEGMTVVADGTDGEHGAVGGVGGSLGSGLVLHFVCEEGCFNGPGALLPPLGDEALVGFPFDEEHAGEDAMFGAVAGGVAFAVMANWAFGFLGVGSVGCEFFF
jgi:hypothetical protein